jgi:hypothetical protein
MTYSFADCIQAKSKRMESGCASTILACANRTREKQSDARNASGKKSLGIFELVAHITAFPQ